MLVVVVWPEYKYNVSGRVRRKIYRVDLMGNVHDDGHLATIKVLVLLALGRGMRSEGWIQ